MKLSENLLEQIKAGKGVELTMIPGHINTPKTPEEIFDIEYASDGSEFKRTINPDRWIKWLQAVASANSSADEDITSKSIAKSTFHENCVHAFSDIKQHLERHDDTFYSGARWNVGGQIYSIPLENFQIMDSIVALKQIHQSTIQPKSNNPFDRYKNLNAISNAESLFEIVMGEDD